VKKKLVALLLVVVAVAAFAGTASAKARGDIIWLYSAPGHAYGIYK
jgi:ABC-type glycerol-3-phosphate transport system substrate-binding protein